jgi:serine/threonine-protein kinase
VPDDPDLLDVALRFADGMPIAWSEEASRLSPADASALEKLRQIHAIAQLHRSPDGGEPPIHATMRSSPHVEGGAPIRWGPLEIRERIGRGAYGDVYAAWDSRLGREVALKLLRHRDDGATDSSSLVREAHLISRVRHHNVVTVYGAERIEGRTGLWMEYVRGETLEEYVRRNGPLPAQEVGAIGAVLCAALQAVHHAGVVHRDVKAQNIMREADGRIVLMDFGTGDEAVSADAQVLAGTPAYLAPELLAGASASVASDQYALGVVLFRLATGRYPVDGDHIRSLRSAHLKGALRDIPEQLEHLPETLARGIAKALAHDPAERFASLGELRDALAQAAMPRATSRLAITAVAIASALLVVAFATSRWLKAPASRDTPVTQTLWSGADATTANDGTGSQDGRYISIVDHANGALGIRDLVEDTSKWLVRPTPPQRVESSAISRDASRVAYLWWTGTAYQLRSTSTHAPNADVHVLVDGSSGEYRFVPSDWSPDGRWIAASRSGPDYATDVIVVDSTNGAVRVLKTSDRPAGSRMSFSPDGRHLAYDLGGQQPNHDIGVFRIEESGATEVAYLPNPSRDVIAGWSPDGSRLLFISDRTGAFGLWELDLGHHNAQRLIRPSTDGRPLVVTSTGTLLLHVNVSTRDIHIASVDVESGKLVSPPRPAVSAFVGHNRSPLFSPDGRWLAYLSTRTNAGPGVHLSLQSLEDGGVRQWPLPLGQFRQLSWSPDSSLIAGQASTPEPGVYVIDVATGRFVRIVEAGSFPQLTADRDVVFFRRPSDSQPMEYIERHLSSRTERVVLRGGHMIDPTLSPDGKRVAMIERDGDNWILRVADVDKGIVRDIYRSANERWRPFLRWVPDGRALLFAKQGAFWIIPATGGEPRRVDVGMSTASSSPEDASIHPDRRRIAFVAGETGTEVWAIASVVR